MVFVTPAIDHSLQAYLQSQLSNRILFTAHQQFVQTLTTMEAASPQNYDKETLHSPQTTPSEVVESQNGTRYESHSPDSGLHSPAHPFLPPPPSPGGGQVGDRDGRMVEEIEELLTEDSSSIDHLITTNPVDANIAAAKNERVSIAEEKREPSSSSSSSSSSATHSVPTVQTTIESKQDDSRPRSGNIIWFYLWIADNNNYNYNYNYIMLR